MLFVYYHQRKLPELDSLLKECMGTNDNLCLTCSNATEYLGAGRPHNSAC